MVDQHRGEPGERFGDLGDAAWRTAVGVLAVVVLGVTVIGWGGS